MHGVADHVAALRRFNRFYTQRIGVLREGWVSSPFSLAQARVLYEIIQRDRPTATEIAGDLGLDPGYLSRILRDFEAAGLIRRQASETDGRRSLLSITERGRKKFAPVEAHTRLGGPRPARSARARRLGRSWSTPRRPSSGCSVRSRSRQPDYSLRPPRPGDMGWIVSRHAVLYAQEYGWTDPFEGLCAQIVADFVNNFDAQRERCWIAETGGENAGCVMLVKDTRRGRPACGCCWSSRQRAGSGSAHGWSTSACSSRARPAIAGSRCGPTASCCRPGISTSARASSSHRASRAKAGARTWSAKSGT